jgi:predicted regulator of Ras-like GTPase activity (Roadblock/LC7/MglB family)
VSQGTLRDRLRDVLRAVTPTPGVLGALLADAGDGIVVASSLDVGLDAEAVGALAATLLARAERAATVAGRGSAGVIHLHSALGWLCAARAGAHVLVVVADRRAPVGHVRSALLRARASLADL